MGIHLGEVMNPREKFFLPAGRFRLKHSLLLHIALVGTFLQAARPAKADTIRDLVIVFQDSTDSVGVKVIGVSDQRVTTSSVLPEQISVLVSEPIIDAHVQSLNFPSFPAVNIDEGDGTVSDFFAIPFFIPERTHSQYHALFSSDPNRGIGGRCSQERLGCQITEDGTVQTIGTVTWTDGTVDTIRFQSDSEVPEPSTILLMLTGFAATLALSRSC